jgi:hypothetical protein
MTKQAKSASLDLTPQGSGAVTENAARLPTLQKIAAWGGRVKKEGQHE